MSAAQLKRLKAALPFASGKAKTELRAMIAALEAPKGDIHNEAARQRDDNDIEIGTAAQGPAAAPRRAAGGIGRGAAVDALPGTATPEKVQAGGRLTSPEPSSGSGQIAGAAASAIPPAISDGGTPEILHRVLPDTLLQTTLGGFAPGEPAPPRQAPSPSHCLTGEPPPLAARDVAPGEKWAFCEHRSQAEVASPAPPVELGGGDDILVALSPAVERMGLLKKRHRPQFLHRQDDRARSAGKGALGRSLKHREKLDLDEPAQAAEPAADAEFEPRQAPIWLRRRGKFPLVLLRSIVIGPARPAPVTYDDAGAPHWFQDDLAALADTGSPGFVSRPVIVFAGGASLGDLRSSGL